MAFVEVAVRRCLLAVAVVLLLAACSSDLHDTAEVGSGSSAFTTAIPTTAVTTTTSESSAVPVLPSAVQATFVSRLRRLAAVAGPLRTEFVQARRGDATRALNIGQTVGDEDAVVYVLFVEGSYRFLYDRPCAPDADLSSIPRRCGAVDGGVIAVISADGSLFDGGDYGSAVPDLAALGTLTTTYVDFGPAVIGEPATGGG